MSGLKGVKPPVTRAGSKFSTKALHIRSCFLSYVYGIYQRTLRAPTKENTLVLIAEDIGGEKTKE